MKRTYDQPIVAKHGKLADRTAKLEPKVSGIVIKRPL